MSLEIKSSGFEFRHKQVCGRCSTFVQSGAVFENAIVMVRPKSYTDKITSWGDSSHHGRVIIPVNQAVPVTDKMGVVHFEVPTAVESLSVSGGLDEAYAYESLAHDLATLP